VNICVRGRRHSNSRVQPRASKYYKLRLILEMGEYHEKTA
jgi:hypothetical protein